MRLACKIFTLLITLGPATALEAAIPEMIFTSQLSGRSAGKSLTQLFDLSGKMSFEEVKTGRFEKVKTDIPNFGITTGAAWFQGKLHNNLSAGEWFFDIDTSFIDSVDLYLLRDGQLEHRQGGQMISPTKMESPKAKPSFRVFLQEEETLAFYFRIQDAGGLSFPLVIRTKKESQAHYETELVLMGLYFGALAVMLLYNLFIFVAIRDKSYLFYSIYLVGIISATLSYRGFTDLYIWPEASLWWKNYSLLLFWGILSIGNLFFMANFLGLSRQTPRVHFSYRILVIYTFTLTAAYLFLPAPVSMASLIFSNIPGFTISLAAGVVYYLHGFQPARFYLLGSLSMLVAGIFFLLKIGGIVKVTFFSEFGFQIGSLSEAVLLSIALADRISVIQQEKEEIRIQAMAHEKESLKNRHRIDILKLEAQLLERDLDKARRIQMGLIPTFEHNKLISGLYLPMEKVGGDYYDIIPLAPRGAKTGVFICDVSGHGVSAALISVMIKGLLHNLAPGKNTRHNTENLLEDPGKLMKYLNSFLFPYMHGNFVSAFYGIIDKKDSSIFYASAAHPPPIILSWPGNGKRDPALEFLDLKPQGVPLGIFSEKDKIKVNFPSQKAKLPKKSRVILYSDGFTDTIGYDYNKMDEGLDSFKETVVHPILRQALRRPVHRFTTDISQAILLHHKGNIDDDICALCIEV